MNRRGSERVITDGVKKLVAAGSERICRSLIKDLAHCSLVGSKGVFTRLLVVSECKGSQLAGDESGEE